MKQLSGENGIENGLSDLQSKQKYEDAPKKMGLIPPVQKVRSQRKLLNLELPKLIGKGFSR